MSHQDIDTNHLINLRKAHAQRCAILELKAAQYGLECPPHIATEIEDLRLKIQNINHQLEEIPLPVEPSDEPSIVPQDAIDDLLIVQLQHHITNRLSFTSYDLTIALRTLYPDANILHEQVWPTVRHYMRLVIVLGLYTGDRVLYGNNPARLYRPTNKAIQASLPE